MPIALHNKVFRAPLPPRRLATKMAQSCRLHVDGDVSVQHAWSASLGCGLLALVGFTHVKQHHVHVAVKSHQVPRAVTSYAL